MSFQHFRLGELSMHQPLPAHLMQHQGTTTNINGAPQNHPNSASQSQFAGQMENDNNSFTTNQSKSHTSVSTSSTTKPPYGSGDTDDGYTLIFANLDAFNDWRTREEETQMVEFVKGDTHGSKAVPPRFKDHTKLVCARHSRSGRKKYVKKHPERVRKVPSRKLEGQGCSASISFKTYFDTDEVRACYISQHSHPTGVANLPFTRRGRKATVQNEKDRSRKHLKFADGTGDSTTPVPMVAGTNAITNSSSIQPPHPFSSAVSMLAPLPGQPTFPQPPTPAFGHPYPQQQPQPFGPPHPAISHDRWENMSTLFHSIREHARGFEYPTVSVAALETVLIRLYLESPVGLGTQPPPNPALLPNGNLGQPSAQPPVPVQVAPSAVQSSSGATNGNGINGSGVSGGEEGS